MTVTPLESEAARLVMTNRWAALATMGNDGPAASMVAYSWVSDLTSVLLFLSGLSDHTRNLLSEPRMALVISEADSGEEDPQTLARISLKGRAHVVERTSPEFTDLWGDYVRRLPDAGPRLGLGDFSLFRVVIDEAHFVGGFARAGDIPIDRLSAAALGS